MFVILIRTDVVFPYIKLLLISEERMFSLAFREKNIVSQTLLYVTQTICEMEIDAN